MISFALLAMHFASAPDYSSAWTEVQREIRSRYYARESRKAEMNRLLKKYEPLAKGAKSEAEFDAAMDRMTEEFGDSHFGFFTRDEPGYYLMDALRRGDHAEPIAHLGAWLRPEGDGMTVQMLLDGGEAARNGLRKGDVLFAVDGGPLTVARLRGQSKVPVRSRRGKEERTVTLDVKEQNGGEMFLDATRASVRVIPYQGRQIGYIRLWTLASSSFQTALRNALKGPLKNTDGLVLDLRDGFGGRPEGFGDPFKESYRKPLVVLTNEGTRSAKEILSFDLQRTKRARLVGKRTAGHVLGTFPTPLKGNWAYLEIPMVEVPASGVRLEKRGVTPDVTVPKEFDAEGRDLILAQGLEQLKDVPVGV
ncbi:MAG: S41 family peptidase [Fimbriimonas sp.]